MAYTARTRTCWAKSSLERERAERREPGKAAVLSTVLLVLNYVIVTIAALAFAGIGTTGIGLGNPDNSDDVLAGPWSADGRLTPSPWNTCCSSELNARSRSTGACSSWPSTTP